MVKRSVGGGGGSRLLAETPRARILLVPLVFKILFDSDVDPFFLFWRGRARLAAPARGRDALEPLPRRGAGGRCPGRAHWEGGGEVIPEVPSPSRRGSEATGWGEGRRGVVDSASKGSTRFPWKPVARRQSGVKVRCFLSGFFLPFFVLFVRFLLFRNLEFWQTDCLSDFFFQPRPLCICPPVHTERNIRGSSVAPPPVAVARGPCKRCTSSSGEPRGPLGNARAS